MTIESKLRFSRFVLVFCQAGAAIAVLLMLWSLKLESFALAAANLGCLVALLFLVKVNRLIQKQLAAVQALHPFDRADRRPSADDWLSELPPGLSRRPGLPRGTLRSRSRFR